MRRTYVITYDLNRPGQNYKDLYEAIKSYGWWHCLDSTWMIVTDRSPTAIRDHLRPYIDANDKLLVAAINAPSAWSGFNKQCSDWLEENLN